MVAIHFSQLGGGGFGSVTLDGCDNTNLASIYNVSLLEILQIVNFSFHSASMLPLTLGAKSNNLFHFISRFFRFKFFCFKRKTRLGVLRGFTFLEFKKF